MCANSLSVACQHSHRLVYWQLSYPILFWNNDISDAISKLVLLCCLVRPPDRSRRRSLLHRVVASPGWVTARDLLLSQCSMLVHSGLCVSLTVPYTNLWAETDWLTDRECWSFGVLNKLNWMRVHDLTLCKWKCTMMSWPGDAWEIVAQAINIS